MVRDCCRAVASALLVLSLISCGLSPAPGIPRKADPEVSHTIVQPSLTLAVDLLPSLVGPELLLESAEIAIPDEPEVDHYLRYYREGRRYFLTPALSRRQKVIPLIEEIFRAHGIPMQLAELALLESGFKSDARSPKGAVGMWQFIPSTARRYGLRVTRSLDERRDVVKSTNAAARYLRDLHDSFGCWQLALAAFNAGEGAILKAVNRSGSRNFFEIARRGHLRRETKEFVPRFLALALLSRDISVYAPNEDFAPSEELQFARNAGGGTRRES